jgi:hypothetical protein
MGVGAGVPLAAWRDEPQPAAPSATTIAVMPITSREQFI